MSKIEILVVLEREVMKAVKIEFEGWRFDELSREGRRERLERRKE